ncbi:MAG: hypothetical protein IJ757_04680 [Clostridiales bacterium]|nr:hypothetical protein [Clostridiales bacterium]
MKTMKKLISIVAIAALALSVFACSNETAETVAETEAVASEYDAMSHAEYDAAEIDSEVTVLCTVMATQSWWDNKITVYAADADGAYFIYNMACSEEDAANLTAGTTILVTGYKSEWAGEIEIADATFEFTDVDGIAIAAVDLTADFADEDALLAHQNEYFTMTGLTVEAIGDNEEAFLYSYDGSGSQGDDLYFKVSNGDVSYTFTVESYLTGADTDVYQAVEGLNVGDTIDVAGYLYWYEGVNPHITSVTVR